MVAVSFLGFGCGGEGRADGREAGEAQECRLVLENCMLYASESCDRVESCVRRACFECEREFYECTGSDTVPRCEELQR